MINGTIASTIKNGKYQVNGTNGTAYFVPKNNLSKSDWLAINPELANNKQKKLTINSYKEHTDKQVTWLSGSKHKMTGTINGSDAIKGKNGKNRITIKNILNTVTKSVPIDTLIEIDKLSLT